MGAKRKPECGSCCARPAAPRAQCCCCKLSAPGWEPLSGHFWPPLCAVLSDEPVDAPRLHAWHAPPHRCTAGEPPSYRRWGLQLGEWVACVVAARACCGTLVVLLGPLLVHVAQVGCTPRRTERGTARHGVAGRSRLLQKLPRRGTLPGWTGERHSAARLPTCCAGASHDCTVSRPGGRPSSLSSLRNAAAGAGPPV